MRQLLRPPALTAAAILAAGAGPAAGQAPADAAPSPPRALYVTACASCHGTDGRGNPRIDAPVLAGLSAGYIERQLHGFRLGYRGRHPEDRDGLEMRPMVEELAEAEFAALGAWLASLPVPGPDGAAAVGTDVPGGDPARGRALYAACAVCHGQGGEGNDALGAPRLAGQAAWYTARQLRKFIAGVRGSHPDDTSGASMRAVVAWVEALHEPAPDE